ncbi:MAG: hypothetical protein R2991_02745 [Thermoanaerobaculia bacterium]
MRLPRLAIRPAPRAAILLLAAGLLVAAADPAPPDPEPGKGAIGVSLRGWSPGGADRLEAVEVRFVRADRGDGPYLSNDLIESNYAGKDGRVYLLNAEPGEYAAVAFRTRGGSLFAVRDKQWLFHEKKLIDATTVTVHAGALSFAGDYGVGGTIWRGGAEDMREGNPYAADESQVHYLALMFPEAEGKSTLARIYGSHPVYLATLLERKTRRDAEAEAEFRRKAAAKDFQKLPSWEAVVDTAP